MRFSIAILFASASAALMTAIPVQAADDRISVTFTDYKTGTDFCNAWRCNCINYVPKDSSLSFLNAYCNPGNYQGQNTNSEALVFCNFQNSNGDVHPVNKHVAAATHATIQ